VWGARLWATPTGVESLRDKDIVQVAGGYHYSAARSAQGKVFTWGDPMATALGYVPEHVCL
jgi:alpha-tubulin suppressor-like RCC1 family protein